MEINETALGESTRPFVGYLATERAAIRKVFDDHRGIISPIYADWVFPASMSQTDIIRKLLSTNTDLTVTKKRIGFFVACLTTETKLPVVQLSICHPEDYNHFNNDLGKFLAIQKLATKQSWRYDSDFLFANKSPTDDLRTVYPDQSCPEADLLWHDFRRNYPKNKKFIEHATKKTNLPLGPISIQGSSQDRTGAIYVFKCDNFLYGQYAKFIKRICSYYKISVSPTSIS